MDETRYDFDAVIDRRGTGSVKWDLADRLFKGDGLLPLWVADMDFAAPRPVIEALERRARHGIFGYDACMDAYYDALIGWMRARHDWQIQKDWVVSCPGVVPALNMALQWIRLPLSLGCQAPNGMDGCCLPYFSNRILSQPRD